jgi:hypothetical protein
MVVGSSCLEKGEKTAQRLGPEFIPESHAHAFCHPFREQLEH